MEWEAAVFIAGVLMVTLALFSWGRSRKKTGGPTVTAREHLERVKHKQAVRDDMQALMVEIEQMAKRLGAQLDAKTIHIEKATREAEQRIAELQALRDESALPEARPAVEMGGGEPAEEGAPHEVGAESDAAGAPEPIRDEPHTDPLTRRVYDLSDAGKGPQAIAQELAEQVGKVELILALRQA